MITHDWECDALYFLEQACNEYEKTAPTVYEYLDALYIRMDKQPQTVSLYELRKVSGLKDVDGWMQPNYAANYIYHVMEEIGHATTGHAGF